MSEEELPAKLKSLAAELARLVPRGDALDRDELMFLAGRASGDCPNFRPTKMGLSPSALRCAIAPLLSATLATAATVLVMLALRPAPRFATASRSSDCPRRRM